jgi:1-deoxy-D-xylulose-5-phosphate reductoisomerase
MKRKAIAILGSTGSIGVNTLDVVRQSPSRFRVVALAAGSNTELLRQQIEEFRPKVVSVFQREAAQELRRSCRAEGVELCAGVEGNVAMATIPEVDTVVVGITGMGALLPTVSAIRAGKVVALASKEALVAGGEFVMCERGAKAHILPVDSEHNAIFQVLHNLSTEHVKQLTLTASGGPFLHSTPGELESVTVEEALRHPVWRMGPKISVDSATLMNKGLEVIEARWLFGVEEERIHVVIHPQSIVHCLVELVDGSVFAHMCQPDMRAPIAYALAYPERIHNTVPPLDLASVGQLTFEKADLGKFACLGLAYEALRCGGTMPAVLNATNEVAVEAFLEGAIGFTEIPGVIRRVMDMHEPCPIEDVEQVLEVDRRTREKTRVMTLATGGSR